MKTVKDEDVDFAWIGKGTKAGSRTFYDGESRGGDDNIGCILNILYRYCCHFYSRTSGRIQ